MVQKVVLHTSLSPGAAAERLRASIDEEHRSVFSTSGFQGRHPVIGEVGPYSFRLRKRIRYRNDYARQFYGHFEPEENGTRIEGQFATGRFTKIFMTVWFVFAVGIGAVIFAVALMRLPKGHHAMNTGEWLGLLVPAGLVLGATALLGFGRMLSRGSERLILEHLEATLGARLEPDETDLQPEALRRG